MNKPRQFDNITDNTIVRFFFFTSGIPSIRGYWTFGVVSRRQTHHFCVLPIGHPYVQECRFRYDGMNSADKDAAQIVFPLTQKEQEHPVIQRYKELIAAQYSIKKELLSTHVKIRDGEITPFPQYSTIQI